MIGCAMPTNHDETLLERYQREHRVYEGMNMSKAEELADDIRLLFKNNLLDLEDIGSIEAELRRLSAINAELLEALELADQMLSGANMNATAVENKVRSALSNARGELFNVRAEPPP